MGKKDSQTKRRSPRRRGEIRKGRKEGEKEGNYVWMTWSWYTILHTEVELSPRDLLYNQKYLLIPVLVYWRVCKSPDQNHVHNSEEESLSNTIDPIQCKDIVYISCTWSCSFQLQKESFIKGRLQSLTLLPPDIPWFRLHTEAPRFSKAGYILLCFSPLDSCHTY